VVKRETTASKAASPGRPFVPMPLEYKELGLFAIPEDVPELGVKAGDMGTIASVYEAGRLLDVEITRDDGTSAGFVDVRIDKAGLPRVVGHSPLSSQ
jgi:hypothetical protein